MKVFLFFVFYLPCVFLLGWSKAGTFRHSPQKAIAGFLALLSSMSSAGSQKTAWSKAGQNSSQKWNTVVCLSEPVAAKVERFDGSVGWMADFRTEIAACPFSWHYRFCQKNFFVSTIDVWKKELVCWTRSSLRYWTVIFAHLNTLQAGFV